ncbi:MAG: glycosyltransferase family 39 protein [candidate division Zixibacteria bacterium]
MRKLDSKYIAAFSIFAVALILRLIYFFQVKSGFPGWDTPTIDPLYHDLWAKQIAAGDLLGSGPFFRAPFYAYFLGLIYAIAGPSLAISKIIQHLLGSLSCALIFLFTDRYFNRKTAVLSGLLCAFYWVFIYFEDELLLDSLLVLFSILLIWSIIRVMERPTYKRFFLTGLILGIATITRPNYAVFIPLLLIWLLFYFPKQYRATLLKYSALLAGCFLMILPVTIRNIAVGDDFVVIASQGGINFYIGNNGYADGRSAIIPEFGASWQYADCEYRAKKESGRLGDTLKPSEVSSFYYKKAIKFITGSPFAWLGLMLRKLNYFWNGYEVSNNQNLYFFRQFASITKFLPSLFFIISPFSIYGLLLLFKKEKKYHVVGYFVIIYMLTVIAFFVNSRFRLPVLPFLIILASYAIIRVFDKIRSGDNKR